MNRMGPDLVTVVRPAGSDWQGDPTGIPTETSVAGCFFQPVSTSEQTDARDTVTIDAQLFMPAGTDVVATDRIRYAGAEYQVDGEPMRRHLRGGRKHHVRVELRKVTG